jgi:putative ABC transport system substrate-binding protein
MHELLPSVTVMALLVSPVVPRYSETTIRLSQAAAAAAGLQLHVLRASSEGDFDAVFESLIKLRAGALVIAPDNSEQLAALTVSHALPAIYEFRRFVAAGGLLSYGSSETEYYRLIGAYAARILRGDKPADLPVQRSTKVELIVNLKTAKALGLNVPQTLLARADEIIE